MRTYRRIFAALLLVTTLGLASCGSEDETKPSDNGAPNEPAATGDGGGENNNGGNSGNGQNGEKPDDEPEGEVIRVAVADGSVRKIKGPDSVSVGDRVVIEVTTDVADHVHLHVYDKMVDVAPGKPATLRFVADIPGVFEVELEDSGLLLLELQVE